MSSPFDDPLPASERFIDAALSEHARLGRDECDDELVHRILLATVNRNHAPIRDIKPPPREWRMWMTGSSVAAALVALILVLLSTLKMDRNERQSDQFRFLVGIAGDLENKEISFDGTPPVREAERYGDPLALVAPAGVGEIDPSRLEGSFELITAPEDPSFEIPPSDRNWIRQENFRITADRSYASSDRLTYEGSVVLEHPLFHIEANEIIVHVPRAASSGSLRPLLARGVKVIQQSPQRLAVAEKLSFDPVSGTLTLTGVKLFETPEGELRQFAAGDQLVLEGERFTVESPPLIKYAAPPLVTP